ncbi:MAG: LysR family transcriptional regulator [Oligoflexia bacterium]|nr:LysR family transcriptional regulator [Oligoflexia bacterium]
MDWLNYHHLLYFWTVARHGSVSDAARELKLRQPTISAQIKDLEDNIGHKLFEKDGRRLVLTEHGSIAARYAEQIFSVGQELLAVMRERPTTSTIRLSIGIADVVPKFVAHRLIEPIFSLNEKHALTCLEDAPEQLLAELALHRLDLVISDSPVPAHVSVRAYNHLLGESAVALYGIRAVAKDKQLRESDLGKLPILLPTSNTALRREIDFWFNKRGISPIVAGEFEDSALMKIFGRAGHGLFPAPLIIAKELEAQYQARPVLILKGISEKFYAISLARQIRNPSVTCIIDNAQRVFKKPRT